MERAGAKGTYFIPTKTIKIDPQRLHIHLPMRRIRHAIHTQPRPFHLMHLLRYPPNIMNRTQHITRMRARHKRRLLIEQWAEVFGREERGGGWLGGGGGGRFPPFYGVVLETGETEPGGDVGFVVERGED